MVERLDDVVQVDVFIDWGILLHPGNYAITSRVPYRRENKLKTAYPGCLYVGGFQYLLKFLKV
jgi:hypothetical protein